VHPTVYEVAQHGTQTLGVNLSIMVVGRGNRGNNAVEFER
jgi:cell division GTPase FtsZ